MFAALPTPVLSVTPERIRELNGCEALSKLWTLFSKCKESIENGRRLENISWRLWHRDLLLASQQERYPASEDNLLDEKAYHPPTVVAPVSPDVDHLLLRPLNSLPTQATTSHRTRRFQPHSHYRISTPLPFGQILYDILQHAAPLPGSAPLPLSSPHNGIDGVTQISRPGPVFGPMGLLGRSELDDHTLDLPHSTLFPLLPLPEHISGSQQQTDSQFLTPETERNESATLFWNALKYVLPTPSVSDPYRSSTPAINGNVSVLSVTVPTPRLVVVNPTPGPTPHPTPPATPSLSSPGDPGTPRRNDGQYLTLPRKRFPAHHLSPMPAVVGVSNATTSPSDDTGDNALSSGGEGRMDDGPLPVQALEPRNALPARDPMSGGNQSRDNVRQLPASQNPHRLSSVSTISTTATATSETTAPSQLSVGSTNVQTDDSCKDEFPCVSRNVTLAAELSNIDKSPHRVAAAPSPSTSDVASMALLTSATSADSSKSIVSFKARTTVAASRNGKKGSAGLVRRASGGTANIGGRSRTARTSGNSRPTSNSSDASRSRSRDVVVRGTGPNSADAAAAGAFATAMCMSTTSIRAGGASGRKRLGGGKGKSRVTLARTSSKGAGIGGMALTRTLSHEEVEEVSDEDRDEEDITLPAATVGATVEVGSSKPISGFGSNLDEEIGVAKSVGTEISSRAPGSSIVPSAVGLNVVSLNASSGIEDVGSKGKGEGVDTQRELLGGAQDHVFQQGALAKKPAVEMQKMREAKREQRRKMSEGGASPELSAGPSLPAKGMALMLTSESEYTDTDEDSWTSEEVEGAQPLRQPTTTRQASQPEVPRRHQEGQHPVHAVQPQHQQHPQRPPTPLKRSQSSTSGHGRNTRREMQHMQHRQEAHLRVQKATAQLQREQEEEARTREMFAKRPTASFQSQGQVNRTQSFGLLSQLLNPDPAIFPPNHPYRRGYSSGEIPRLNMTSMTMTPAQPQPGALQLPEKPVEHQAAQQRQQQAPRERPQRRASSQEPIQPAPPPIPTPVALSADLPPPLANDATPNVPPSPVTSEQRQPLSNNPVVALALRGMRSLGMQLRKSSAATPVSSQVQVGSVKPKGSAPPAIAPELHSGSISGQRYKGPLPGQEMEDTDSEDEADSGVGLSESLAQHRLSLFAARQGIHASGAVLPTHHESDEIPSWARVAMGVEQEQQQRPNVESVAAAVRPIPVMHPYNLPFNAAPSTPQTTRRQMLRNEMPESLRRQLLWERQQAGIRRTTSGVVAAGPSRHEALNPLRPYTAAPSMVQLHAKGTVKKEKEQGQQGSGGEGSGERQRRAGGSRPADAGNIEEERRKAMARNRSWAGDFHIAGW